ncbi:MAG: PP2C family protein-serine/threonine phosphatase [Acidimicrobiales bacterium]
MLISKSISAGHTDIGKVRATNEDHYLVADLNKSMTVHSSTLPIEDETEFYAGLRAQLLLVADGMGGVPGGDIASQIGVGTAARYVLNTMPWFLSLEHDHEDDQQEELIAALLESEEAVESEARIHPEFDGMGTTLTMAYIVWPRLFVVHIGDSRCYVLRSGQLSQLTSDQTAAQALIDDGTMTPEQAARSPLGHILISSIGQGLSTFQPEVYKAKLEAGDRVLVCSDGLTSELADEEIAEILAADESAEVVSRALVDAANAAGGSDNITAVVSICHPPINRPDRVSTRS